MISTIVSRHIMLLNFYNYLSDSFLFVLLHKLRNLFNFQFMQMCACVLFAVAAETIRKVVTMICENQLALRDYSKYVFGCVYVCVLGCSITNRTEKPKRIKNDNHHLPYVIHMSISKIRLVLKSRSQSSLCPPAAATRLAGTPLTPLPFGGTFLGD